MPILLHTPKSKTNNSSEKIEYVSANYFATTKIQTMCQTHCETKSLNLSKFSTAHLGFRQTVVASADFLIGNFGCGIPVLTSCLQDQRMA